MVDVAVKIDIKLHYLRLNCLKIQFSQLEFFHFQKLPVEERLAVHVGNLHADQNLESPRAAELQYTVMGQSDDGHVMVVIDELEDDVFVH